MEGRLRELLARWDQERSSGEALALGPAALARLLDACDGHGSLHRPGDDPRDYEDALHAAIAAFAARDPGGVLAQMRARGWSTRQALRSGLGRAADPLVVSLLLEACASADPFDRCSAVEDLGLQRDPRATAALARALSDRSSQVRSAAVRSLGGAGDPGAIPALQEFEKRVRGSARNGWMAADARAAIARIRRTPRVRSGRRPT